ncbi:MAG: SDR family oxidoreductase [Kordiimonadaceae bacterium]|nr:SDR family oxidoreductase [Kordiimonadaceae bacterium]
MDLDIKGRSALVLGGSKGMGFSTAAALAREGVQVAIVARDETALNASALAIGATPIVADLSSRAQVLACIEKTQSTIGNPDILVVNTGGPKPAIFAETSPDGWREAADHLFHFTIEVLTAFLEPMKKRGWGRVVLITSTAAVEPIPTLLYSNVLRAGLHGLVNSLSAEVAQHGITVNAAMPGLIATDRMKSLGLNLGDMQERIPAKRLGQPEEMADLVSFLCSNRAAYITGQAIACDGGLVRKI